MFPSEYHFKTLVTKKPRPFLTAYGRIEAKDKVPTCKQSSCAKSFNDEIDTAKWNSVIVYKQSGETANHHPFWRLRFVFMIKVEQRRNGLHVLERRQDRLRRAATWLLGNRLPSYLHSWRPCIVHSWLTCHPTRSFKESIKTTILT